MKVLRLFPLWLLVGALLSVHPVAAQGNTQPVVANLVAAANVEYRFGQQVKFTASLAEGVAPLAAQVFFRAKGNTQTFSAQASLEQSQVTYVHDLARQSLRAFSEVEYWFSFTLPDGSLALSPNFSFFYEDNRFAWNALQEAPFRVHWYEGDAAFGQMILDVARSGVLRAQDLLVFPPLNLVDIYVYASGADLRSALQLADLTMIAGHADPALGVMVVSLPAGPGQRMEMGRQIPHELMHILLYHRLGARYASLPAWLNEGLASVNEEFPNPDYFVALQEAASRDELLPIAQLCNSFPTDAVNFYLSYAQSVSFVRYLHQTFGISSLEALLDRYADGMACERATQVVYGSDLVQLDRDWRSQTFGQDTRFETVSPLLPWLVVGVAALFGPFLLLGRLVARPASQRR